MVIDEHRYGVMKYMHGDEMFLVIFCDTAEFAPKIDARMILYPYSYWPNAAAQILKWLGLNEKDKFVGELIDKLLKTNCSGDADESDCTQRC